LKKENNSINEFLLRIKTLVDTLTSTGDPVPEHEQLDILVEGLPAEYESFISLINNKPELFTLDEIESLLIAQEMRLERFKTLDNPGSLNLTHTNSQTPSQHNFQLHSTTSTSSQTSHRPFQPGHDYRGRRGGRTGRGSIQCQVCHKYGHNASICYHRFNPNFSHQEYLVQPSSFSPFRSTPSPAPSRALMLPTPHQPLPYVASAYSASVQSPMQQSQTWYIDSGASHHLTPDVTNLIDATSSHGTENVFLGNGQGLAIQLFGSASFP